MGKRILKKPEPPEVRGICVECGENPQAMKGNGKFRASCAACHKLRYPKTAAYLRNYMRLRRQDEGHIEDQYQKRQSVGYKAHKKDHCEKCGFVAEHSCQLDVDHIDGDKANSDPANLQTLCANCHRLKTRQDKNFKRKSVVFTFPPECDTIAFSEPELPKGTP
jgi:5-methylcytosine-specific restriction endonuclease McrA